MLSSTLFLGLSNLSRIFFSLILIYFFSTNKSDLNIYLICLALFQFLSLLFEHGQDISCTKAINDGNEKEILWSSLFLRVLLWLIVILIIYILDGIYHFQFIQEDGLLIKIYLASVLHCLTPNYIFIVMKKQSYLYFVDFLSSVVFGVMVISKGSSITLTEYANYFLFSKAILSIACLYILMRYLFSLRPKEVKFSAKETLFLIKSSTFALVKNVQQNSFQLLGPIFGIHEALIYIDRILRFLYQFGFIFFNFIIFKTYKIKLVLNSRYSVFATVLFLSILSSLVSFFTLELIFNFTPELTLLPIFFLNTSLLFYGLLYTFFILEKSTIKDTTRILALSYFVEVLLFFFAFKGFYILWISFGIIIFYGTKLNKT